jgi:agmatine deiminase
MHGRDAQAGGSSASKLGSRTKRSAGVSPAVARAFSLSPSTRSDESHFRMPAEWSPHAATWLAWPHFRGDWPGKFEPIPWVYAEIIRNLSRYERVELIVNNAASERLARRTLKLAAALNKNVRFHRWPTNRVWTRDSGCTFTTHGGTAASAVQAGRSPAVAGGATGVLARRAERSSAPLHAIKWRFNAWAKYPNYRHDEKIGSLMAGAAKAPEIRAEHNGRRVVLEGGSIDVNGEGTLLTTEECLLSRIQQRNPGFRREDYESVFATYLGIRKVIWLGNGIAGDDTHGHVDDISRFVAPRTILTMVEPNSKDKNHAPLKENLRRLRTATDQDGRPFDIVELPMPAPVIFEGRRLPASYGNFYIANHSVLVPVFNDPNDRVALNTLVEVFPDRAIIPIYSGDLIWGFGALHCMTQQQPAI